MNPWKQLLTSGRVVVVPGVWDGFSARLAQSCGYPAVLLGGYHLGAVVGSLEPLVTATETVDACRQIKRAITIPLRVDVGAGFGEPMHVIRLVKDLKMIGVEAISLDDQHYPKRAHYHRDYQEHIIPLSDALDKIRWAKKAAGDDMFLFARTDAFRTDGATEGIRRCRAYLEAGADGVAVFPNTIEEAAEIPSKVPGPVWYANTRGNRVGRPVLTPRQAQEFGYAGLGDGHVLFFAAFVGMEARATGYSFENSWPDIGDEIAIRNRIEKVKNLQEAYDVEADTVEKPI